jgi:parallel beta-helix repeat protein
MRKRALFTLVLATAAIGRSLADEARIPIFAPATITQPGHYILTRNITVSSGDVIAINANNVTFDLNGRTIASSSISSGTLVAIGDGFEDVAILNGQLSGGGSGIYYFSGTAGTRLRMERLVIQGTSAPVSITGAEYVEMHSCRILGGGSIYGVSVTGVGSGPFGGRFVDNVIRDVGGQGLHIQGLSGGEIRGNQVEHFGTLVSTAPGILLTGTALASASYGGNTIEDNIVRSSDDDAGITIFAGPANLILNNVVTAVGGIGIIIAIDGNRIIGNVVSRNGQGIKVSSVGSAGPTANHNILERNHVEANVGDGVSIANVVLGSDYDLIDSNVIEGNGGVGIKFYTSTGNAYRDNMLRNNALGAIVGTATDAGGNIL